MTTPGPGLDPPPARPPVQPHWRRPSWAAVLLDLRRQHKAAIPDPHLPAEAIRQSCLDRPGWRVTGHTVRHDGTAASRGADSYLVVTAPDGVAAAVAVSRRENSGFAPLVLGKVLPGLLPLLQAGTPDRLVRRGCFDAAIHLHAALLAPHAWAVDDQGALIPDGPRREAAHAALPSWATALVPTAAQAQAWQAAGIPDADTLIQWRRAGFPDGDIPAWHATGMSPRYAARYRGHLPPAVADRYRRYVPEIHPITAGLMHEAGMSATAAKKVRAALIRCHPHLTFADRYEDRVGRRAGDRTLVALAKVRDVPVDLVVLAVRAGLGPGEIRALAKAGTLSRDDLAVLAALR